MNRIIEKTSPGCQIVNVCMKLRWNTFNCSTISSVWGLTVIEACNKCMHVCIHVCINVLHVCTFLERMLRLLKGAEIWLSTISTKEQVNHLRMREISFAYILVLRKVQHDPSNFLHNIVSEGCSNVQENKVCPICSRAAWDHQIPTGCRTQGLATWEVTKEELYM